MGEDTDTDRIAYNYRPSRALWNDWKLTVRRDKSLDTRLDELLELDRDHDLERVIKERKAQTISDDAKSVLEAVERVINGPDNSDERIRLDAVRIRRRCMTALPAAREQGADRAAEELAEIQQIANDLLELE